MWHMPYGILSSDLPVVISHIPICGVKHAFYLVFSLPISKNVQKLEFCANSRRDIKTFIC